MTESERPDDELEAKPAAGAEARPEVYAIRRGQSGWTLSRRSLFSAADAAPETPSFRCLLQRRLAEAWIAASAGASRLPGPRNPPSLEEP